MKLTKDNLKFSIMNIVLAAIITAIIAVLAKVTSKEVLLVCFIVIQVGLDITQFESIKKRSIKNLSVDFDKQTITKAVKIWLGIEIAGWEPKI